MSVPSVASGRRVVVTGLGVLTPPAPGAAALAADLRAGRSAVGPVRHADASALPVRIAGYIAGFDPAAYLPKKERKRLSIMPRAIQLAVAGAQLAVSDARLTPGAFDPARFAVVFGAGTVPHDLTDLGPIAQRCCDPASGAIDMERWGREAPQTVPPLWMLNHVPNMPACHAAILHNAQGPCNSITQTELGGLLALGEAFRMVRHGRADLALGGGGDSRVEAISLARNLTFAELSRRNDEPGRACRPFDRDRDGEVLSEGAGVLVLEELEHARRRGAAVHAEVLGFAARFDGRRDGEGVARAAAAALKEAGITTADLDHVNARGSGKRRDDVWEARGLRQLDAALPVFAVRGAVGNLMVGSAGGELAASLLALRDGVLPATLNCENVDPECAVAVVREPRPVRRPFVLKLGATELGQCAALVVRRWE